MIPSKCKKELHVKDKPSEPIKPEIKRILDSGGNYVLVLLADISDGKKEAREQAIREELANLGYHDAAIRIYTASQLQGWAEQLPALVSWLKGGQGYCIPYTSWALHNDITTPSHFVAKGEREAWIKQIREKFRNSGDECVVFRVTGLPGVGKTRFVFEALNSDDLKYLVTFSLADQFRSSNLRTALEINDNLSAIIVIDECDPQQHDEFVKSFAARGGRLALITISHDLTVVPPPSLELALSPLTVDEIREIVSSELPSLPSDVAQRISTFAGGYPRIAVLLVQSYSENPSGEFLRIRDGLLMDRLIGGSGHPDSEHFRRTKRVLTSISLFEKVGFEGSLSAEARWLSQYFSIPWDDYQEIVGEQRRRGITQGQYYVYVTPLVLRVHLLTEWWDRSGFTGETFAKFVDSIPTGFRADLVKRFLSHVPYIHATERGREFAKAIFG